jgi:hypothetical protein
MKTSVFRSRRVDGKVYQLLTKQFRGTSIGSAMTGQWQASNKADFLAEYGYDRARSSRLDCCGHRRSLQAAVYRPVLGAGDVYMAWTTVNVIIAGWRYTDAWLS